MTKLSESELTKELDCRGLLDDARGPGCYALRLHVPDDLGAAWDAKFDVRPDGLVDRFTNSDAVLYCGASKNVYGRLCDHISGERRRAAVLQVCEPEALVDVTPSETPFEDEHNYALTWSAPGVTVWKDGSLF